MLAAIRYRRVQALVLLVLSALIAACAILTPLYDRAMQQALTRLTLDTATSSDTAIQLRSVSRFAYSEGGDVKPAPVDALAGLLPADVRPWFGPPVAGTSVLVTRSDQTGASPTGALRWRDGACEHVRWLAGGCPARPGDIAVTEADARNFRLTVGSGTTVVEQPAVDVRDELPDVPLRVTGVYRQLPGPYWTDEVLAGSSGAISTQPPYRPQHDTWLTARGTFAGAWLDPQNSVTYVLDRPAVGVGALARTATAVVAVTQSSRVQVDDLGYRINAPSAVLADVRSGLPELNDVVERGRRQALVTVPLLMTQLGLLALFVLVLTLGAAVEQRRPEVAVARLRGAGRYGAGRLVLAELLPVVLAGVPVGTVVALGTAAVLRHTALHGAAPAELTPGFWLAVLAAAVLLAAVTAVAVGWGSRDRIPALLRSVPPKAPGHLVDVVVLVGAGTAAALFVTGNLSGSAALAAPALLALVAGLLLAQLTGPVATRVGRWLLHRGRYASALAALAVARRPATRRVVTVVTVASALLVFSAYAVSVGGRNRDLAARRETGAPAVADLTGTDVARVRAVVAAAGGGHATPVVRIDPAKGSFRTTLAVDPDAFRRIALFPDADPATVPWSGLTVPTGRRLGLTGGSVSVGVTAGPVGTQEPTAALRLLLLDAGGRDQTVELGPLPAGRTARLTAPVPCGTGCTVVGFSVSVTYGAAYDRDFRIDDVRVPGGTTELPGTAADWAPATDRSARISATAAGGGLRVRAYGDGRTTPALTSRYFPTPLPAVVAGRDPGARAGTVAGSDLGGSDRLLNRVAGLPRVPGVDGAATVVSLDLLSHWGAQAGDTATVQVWFDTEDPAAYEPVRAALTRAGVEVSAVRRLSEVRAGYDASVPAWSLRLGVLAAGAGLLLAALVLVQLVASSWRRRTRDLACLALTGVPRRGLRRVAVGEQLPTALLAALAGAGCGIAGAVLALPTVPLFAVDRPASTLDLSAPWPVVLAVLAVALVVLGAVAWLGGLVVARAGDRLSRVRETL